MRAAFVQTLTEMAQQDSRIFLLTADLGWSVLEPFATAFPERFLNVGVAEQNLVGVATGLAQVGYVPFIYSIANFVSMRCYEQIRNGPVLHELPVRIVGVGGGYAYGHAGPTHHALEDLSILRALSGLTVVAPADPAQTRTSLWSSTEWPGPAYFRVGKGGNSRIAGLEGRFALGRPELVCPGKRLLMLATGAIAAETVQAANLLQADGESVAVAILAHLGQSAGPAVVRLLAGFPAVITVEEGVTPGGLGELIARTVAEHRLECRLKACGVTFPFRGSCGSRNYLLGRAKLSASQIAKAAQSLLACRQAA